MWLNSRTNPQTMIVQCLFMRKLINNFDVFHVEPLNICFLFLICLFSFENDGEANLSRSIWGDC